MKYIKLSDYFRPILLEVVKADTEFKLQQAWFRRNKNDSAGHVAEPVLKELEREYMSEVLAQDQLNIDTLELCLYLKKKRPSFFRRILLAIRHIKPDYLFDLGTASDHQVPVKFIIKRVNAVEKLKGSIEPQEYQDKYIAV